MVKHIHTPAIKRTFPFLSKALLKSIEGWWIICKCGQIIITKPVNSSFDPNRKPITRQDLEKGLHKWLT